MDEDAEEGSADGAAVGVGKAGRGGSALAADLELVDALRRGDEAAFALLVEQYNATLRRIAALYVSSPAVAEEVVQDTWLGVIRGLWAFEGRSSLKTWILRVLVNRAKTRAVREGRTVPFADLASDDHEARDQSSGRKPSTHTAVAAQATSLSDPGPSPEKAFLAQEAYERLTTAIESLPPNLRLVLTMRDVEGCSSAEVCNVLDISETNQRVLLHRARTRVRAALRPYLERG